MTSKLNLALTSFSFFMLLENVIVIDVRLNISGPTENFVKYTVHNCSTYKQRNNQTDKQTNQRSIALTSEHCSCTCNK